MSGPTATGRACKNPNEESQNAATGAPPSAGRPSHEFGYLTFTLVLPALALYFESSGGVNTIEIEYLPELRPEKKYFDAPS